MPRRQEQGLLTDTRRDYRTRINFHRNRTVSFPMGCFRSSNLALSRGAWQRRGALVLLLSVLVTSGPMGQEQDSAERDYSRELPRIQPVAAEDALATFQIADGFRLEQVAAEPLVVDPIAMAFDADGRLFVVEMRDYSEDGDKNLGRIRLLVDADEDGRFEQSYIFAEGLSWPTAVTCYDGGIFVGAAPDIFYLKDTDGDHRADVQQVVFTGFSRGNVQGLINTFTWGLDNRIHGATSSSGADVLPIPTDEGTQPLVLRGRDFAIEPRTMTITATSGGAQHGLSFNSWGDKFVCSNSDHLQHVRFEDRYLARNPYFAAPGPRASIAADGPQADVFRSSPIEPWRIVRTRLRVKGLVPGPVEGGGTPAGYFTGATGATIFRGNAWPSEYVGWAMIGDVGSNLVHRKRLEEVGASYLARRVDEMSEFLTSTDIWFRPVQFANAPDGALYIADMYRETIEHPASLPPVIKKHLDLTSGRDRGRIYRIVGEGFQQPALPRLSRASTAELVQHLAHPNGWHRETAARLLYERQDRAAIAPLDALSKSSPMPEGRMHALYALDGLNALSPEVILQALADPHPRVREHAVRLSERVAGESAEVRQRLYALVADPAFRVRYQLAFTLGELTGAQRHAALAQLITQDGHDALMRVAATSSLAEGAGDVLAILTENKPFRESEVGQAWITALAAQIGKQQRSDDLAAVLDLLRRMPPEETAAIRAIVQGLAAKSGSELQRQLAAVTGGQAEKLMRELLAEATQTAGHREAALPQRVAAVQRLRLGSLAGREELFFSLLAPSEPAEVQSAAIATLSAYESPEVAALLIQQWRGLSPSLRLRAADALFSRDAWLPSLLEAMEAGQIAVGDLEPTRLRLLAMHRDAAIQQRVQQLLAKNQLSNRADVIAAYRDVLETAGDVTRGKAVFQKVCAACHQLEGVGHPLAPNLAAMRNRGPEAILTNILAPNQEVNPQYLNYVLLTTDGRMLTGMITAETATSVTLQRQDNAADSVLRIDIDELRSTGVSLMPEGLEKQIDKQAMADLMAYLQSIP